MRVRITKPTYIFEIPKKQNSRGAKVFGKPISREVASYLDDVSRDSKQRRLVAMFFGDSMEGDFNGGAEDDFI